MKISLRLLILALFFFNVAAYGAVTNEELGKLLLKGNYSAVTQNYNVYCSAADCRLKKAGYHSGIDYRAKTPLTVYSPVSGIVSSVGYGATNYGRVSIKIDGTNDYFMFLHLSKFSITQGRVEVGTPIGLTGDVGASGAPHLHVEVRTGKDNPSPYFPTEKDFGVNKNPASVVSSSQIQVKDFWVKSAPIVANQTNGFDAQFKLTNSSTSTQTFAKVVLAIHDANNNWIKDMKLFPNVNITAGQTWQTNLVATTSPNAGN
jgi:murein DD-endopeptidase MepM/ murein hydrolase activator NlpD